jgi:hypothetical protein
MVAKIEVTALTLMVRAGHWLARLGEAVTHRADTMLGKVDSLAEARGHSMDDVLAPLFRQR